MSFPKRWWGKLFHSLMILMKKEYLKAFTFADFLPRPGAISCFVHSSTNRNQTCWSHDLGEQSVETHIYNRKHLLNARI